MSNNSFIALEKPNELVVEKTQEREVVLTRIIEAVEEIKSSKSWSTLKTEHLEPNIKSLKKDLWHEAKSENPNTNKLNRLTGELKWLENLSDLEKYEKSLRVELQGVKLRLHGN